MFLLVMTCILFIVSCSPVYYAEVRWSYEAVLAKTSGPYHTDEKGRYSLKKPVSLITIEEKGWLR